jgi:hypothetical protein
VTIQIAGDLRVLDIKFLQFVRNVRRRLLALLVPCLIGISGCASMQTVGASMRNCDLKEPPPDSGEDGDHGILIKIYPRRGAIGSTYSGCQTMWAFDGATWSVVTVGVFEDGKITRMRVPSRPEDPLEQCLFQSGRLVRGNEGTCSSLDMLPYNSMPPGCASAAKGHEPRDCDYD